VKVLTKKGEGSEMFNFSPLVLILLIKTLKSQIYFIASIIMPIPIILCLKKGIFLFEIFEKYFKLTGENFRKIS
jgi:hypothetical protein